MDIISLLTLLFLIANTHFASANRYKCLTTSSSNGADIINRNTLLYGLPAHAMDQGGYYYSHTGNTSDISSPQGASPEFCLALCRKDISSSSSCAACMTDSIFDITHNCPYQRDVTGWGKDAGCVVRCVPHEFPTMFETEPVDHACNDSNVVQVHLTMFEHGVANLTRNIAESAAGDVNTRHYYAAGKVNLSRNLSVYGVGYCLPTLSPTSCTDCLRAAGNVSGSVCNGKQGATIFTPSCVLRYEFYNFYESSSRVDPSTNNSIPVVRTETRGNRTHTDTIVFPLIAVLAVITLAAYVTIVVKKRKQKRANQFGPNTRESCLEFSLHTLRVATNNFCAANKLGQGGFGAVYKGKLRNGQEIAVKRLTVLSLRGEVEFKNEVRLMAKLDHKNLIRLIGFCIEQNERLLIYELALNGSLDHYLFDSINREKLTWESRYNIIEGITQGMIYLHEECEMRILHRDLKASNVLLDECMDPKISDFGTARLYVEDQGTASKIVGTYGYMSPEYVKHGKAWKHWKRGNTERLIDPILLKTNCQTDEITKCIHIGLLCVQEIAECRPIMKSVIEMLKGCSETSLSPPLKPAYFMNIGDDEPYVSTMDPNHLPSSKPHLSWLPSDELSSINEFTITQPYPDPR